KRAFTSSTRLGDSAPWSWSKSGPSASMLAAISASSASTDSATLRARPRIRPPRARAVAASTWRGGGGKNTQPTISARAWSATSSASGVFRPQILITKGMLKWSLSANFTWATRRIPTFDDRRSWRRGDDGREAKDRGRLLWVRFAGDASDKKGGP